MAPGFNRGKNFRKETMKNFLIMLSVIFAQSLQAAPALTANGAYQIDRKDKLNRDNYVGTKLYDAQQFGVKATWSYADQGGAASSDLTLHDAQGNAVTLPTGAIIRDCLIDVVTQPASSTGSATLAFSSKAVADLKAAAAVASYTTTTPIVCLPVGTVGTMIKTSSELTLKVRTGSEALTAGKINLWIEYVLSE